MFCHGLLSAEVQFHKRCFPHWLRQALSANIGQVAPLKQLAFKGIGAPPGTAYAYSSFGYFLLGRLIEQVSGICPPVNAFLLRISPLVIRYASGDIFLLNTLALSCR